MTILITGGNGYIGKSIYNNLKDKYKITKVSRFDFDLLDEEATNRFFKDKLFDVVIHCAIVGGSRLQEDDWSVNKKNLSMYDNIVKNANNFRKLIYFGSGAELFACDKPYGFSKKLIAESISKKENFYNLRIFGVFDENELDTRFIKSNIKRYINRESLKIHQNKYMDFFYMKDLIKLVDYYINEKNPQKEINCNYSTVFTLEKIAMIINELGDYKLDIIKERQDFVENYCYENLTFPNIELYGLKHGIKEVYNRLK